MGIMDKLKKNSRVKGADVLSDSTLFNDSMVCKTPVPMVNVALSGDLDGGLTAGLTVLAGPSKHFKTSFALLLASAYMNEHKDAILLFYDSEFGSPQSYFEQFGIDTERVFHTPVTDVEELTFDIVNQLADIDREDKVIIVIDSIGNLASKKETEDALNAKSVADMTRAKSLKGLFRMVTPKFKMKDIPCIAVNHTYQELGLYPKAIVSGGTGIYYSADTIWIIGRQQEKNDKTKKIEGYHFVVNVEKSRFVKEKSKIPITVSWEGGIEKWSGLLEVAVAGNFVHKGKKGNSLGYSHMNAETGEAEDRVFYARETMNEEFWKPVIDNENFQKFVQKQFQVGHSSPVDPDSIVDDAVLE